jgi:chromosome segregation ATPase
MQSDVAPCRCTITYCLVYRTNTKATSLPTDLFFSPGFKTFYEVQVELIRKGIFDLYSGGDSKAGSAEECSLREIVEMQKEKIQELEEKISTYSLTGKIDLEPVAARTDVSPEALQNEVKELSSKIVELESCLAAHEVQKKEAEEAAKAANEQLYEQEQNLTLSRSKILELEEALVARSEDLEGMVRGEAAIAAEADSLRRRAEVAEKTGM